MQYAEICRCFAPVQCLLHVYYCCSSRYFAEEIFAIGYDVFVSFASSRQSELSFVGWQAIAEGQGGRRAQNQVAAGVTPCQEPMPLYGRNKLACAKMCSIYALLHRCQNTMVWVDAGSGGLLSASLKVHQTVGPNVALMSWYAGVQPCVLGMVCH